MNKTPKEKEAVLNLFTAMLRPLMRLAFEYGIGANEIARALKRTYIQTLEARLNEQGRPTTDARLAVTAGLPRSEVASLRDSSGLHSMNEGLNPERIGIVMTTWHTDKRFIGAYGIPQDLDLVSAHGSPRPSFPELVAVACPDGTDVEGLLDALLVAKSVEVVDGTVRSVSRAYVTSSPDVARIETVGRFTAIVNSTLVHNLLRSDAEPAYFERAVVSDAKLTETGRDAFLSMVRERGPELLFELDNFITTRMDASQRSESGKRYGLGMYFFEDPTGDRTSRVNEELRSSRRPPTGETTANDPKEIDVLAALSGKKS